MKSSLLASIKMRSFQFTRILPDLCIWEDDQGTTKVTVQGDNVTADEDVIAITITNDRGASLPNAGGTGTALFTRLGLMLIGFAGAVFMVRRRRGRASS